MFDVSRDRLADSRDLIRFNAEPLRGQLLCALIGTIFNLGIPLQSPSHSHC